MKQVPEAYIEALESDCRNLYCRVYIELGPLGTPYRLFHADDIFDYDFTRELQDAGVPCAYLGQNVATIKLFNENNRFKEDVNYAQFLKRGAKIRLDCCIALGAGLYGPDYFVGWLDSYEFSDDGQYVTITAYDSLHYLKNQPSPWFRPSLVNDIGFTEFIKYYLEMCGLSEANNEQDYEAHWDVMYIIDKSISAKLKPLIDSSGTIGDVLTAIAQVALCAVFCDADDNLRIQLVPRTRHLVYTMTDYDQVFSSASSTLGYTDYTDVAINVYDTCAKTAYSIKQTSTAYTGDQMLLAQGENDFNNLELHESTYPVVVSIMQDTRLANTVVETGPTAYTWIPYHEAQKMPMSGALVYVTSFDYRNDAMSLNLWGGQGVVVDMQVFSIDEGRAVGTVVTSVDETDDVDNFFLMKKTLKIDNKLMTSASYAQLCANTYAKLISSIGQHISCSCRGMPPLELLDLIAISNPMAAHDNEQVLITRMSYSYNGVLSCNMDTMSYAVVVMLTYAFLSPGFYIPYDPGAIYITASCKPHNAGMVEGTGAYAYGDNTRLSVTPQLGWKFDHWEDDKGARLTDSGYLVREVIGPAEYFAVMVEDAQFTIITVDVTVNEPTVTIPIFSLTPVNGTIDWGDGTEEEYDAQSEYDHTYDIAGTMIITLKAPIENMAFELFANNTSINTFTAGSTLLYMPNGMFYNSSVKNVNLLPAKNMTMFASSFSDTYGPSEAYFSMTNSPPSGVSNRFNMSNLINEDPNEYSGAVTINVGTGGHALVPSYYNGYVVESAYINNASTNTVTTSNAGLVSLSVYAPSTVTALNGINMQGDVEKLALYNVTGAIRNITTSRSTQNINMSNLSTLRELHLYGWAPSVAKLVNAVNLTDIYLHHCEVAHFDALPAQTINVHMYDITVLDIRGANNNIVIMNDIT
jgi:hypothetical protein